MSGLTQPTEVEPGHAERRHLGGGVLASTASQVVILVGQAATSVAIARILGPSGTGSFALAASFFGVGLLLVGLGLKQGVVFLVGSGRWSPRDAVRDLALPVLGLGLAGTGLALVAYDAAQDGALEGVPAAAAITVAAVIPLGLAWQLCWSLALAKDRYEAYAVLFALPTVVALVTAVILALTSGVTGAIVGFAAAQAISGLVAAAWASRFARRWPDQRDAAASRGSRLRTVLGFGLQTWSSELLQFVNYRFDLFILSAFAATADVGVYSIAATATGIGLVLPQALSVAVMPRAAALEGATREGEIDAGEADLSDIRTSRHTLLLLPVSALVVALLLAVGVPVLYGDAFEDSIRLGFILLPGVLALGLGRVFFAIVIGRGRPRYPLYTVLITVPPTVAGYLLVIPDHGATGAAIVSSGSYLLTAVITFAFFRHLTGIGARRAFIPERADLRAYPEVLALSLDYARSLARLLAPRRR